MEHTFNKNKYKGFIKVVKMIVKVLMIILYVVLAFVALGFVASVIIPYDVFNINLSEYQHLRNYYLDIINSIDPTILDRTINIKRLLTSMMLAGLINIGFVQFIFYHIHKLLRNVDEQPFSNENVMALKNLGIGFIVAGIFTSMFSEFVRVTLVKTLNIFSTNFDFSLNMQHIFIGSLILILSYIFSYGLYLQEEIDQTV